MSDLLLPAQWCERIYEYTMTGTAPAWFEPEALAFRQRVLESIEGLSPLALAERAERLNREQVTHLSRRCLNLYPGTNIPGMTANFHTNRLPALAVAAAETLAFGQGYARACVNNARALATGFKEAGLTVAGERQGYTAGHMLALDVSEQGGGQAAVAALESAHIICNMNLNAVLLKVLNYPGKLSLTYETMRGTI